MKYYLLHHASKTNGILSPGLNGKYVKGYEDFFDNDKCGPLTFYEKDYEFDYLVPVEFGEIKEEPNIIVDYHTWIGLEVPFGGLFIPISKRLKEIVERYCQPEHRFYKAKVLFQGEFYPYFVWRVLSKKYQEYLDFTKTRYNNLSLSRKLKHEQLEIKQFNSYDEMRVYSRSHWKNHWNYERIVMHPSFRELDFLYMYRVGNIVSERLKEAIEAAGITGVEFRPVPVPIEFSDEVE